MSLKCIDLFSGAGGLSLGFQNAGFDIIMFCEYIDNFAKTYKKNIKCDLNIEDIVKKKPEDLMKQYSINPNEVDIIIGGPPCQGFSLANTKKKFIIQQNNKLVKHYINYIDKFRPKAFVMENVPNMLNKEFKFYLTNDPQEEDDLKKIGIMLKKESISLGSTIFSDNLVKKLNELKNEHIANVEEIHLKIDDGDEIISIKKYSEMLGHLLDVILKEENEIVSGDSGLVSELKECINKINISKLKKTKKILNTSTKNKIDHIINLISYSCISRKKIEDINNTWNCFKEYEKILNILMNYNELVANNIKFNKFTQNPLRNIVTEVYSYNIVEYCEAKFNNFGYFFDKRILNAAYYGVPQLRNRLVFIGILSDYNNLQKKDDLFPKEILDIDEFLTLESAISDLYDIVPISNMSEYHELSYDNSKAISEYQKLMRIKSKTIKNHINTNTRPNILKRFEMIKQGSNYKDVLTNLKNDYDKVSNTHSTIYLRPQLDQPSKTVPNIRKSMWIHPIKNRAISIREAARIQSFPDDFEFFGTKDQQYQQIGNAVPPLMSQAIAEHIKFILTGKYNYSFKSGIKKLSINKKDILKVN